MENVFQLDRLKKILILDKILLEEKKFPILATNVFMLVSFLLQTATYYVERVN